MGVFEALHSLAIALLTARPGDGLYRHTVHHCDSLSAANEVLQAAVLQRTTPGETSSTRWGVLRIFMRNLVNRAQAPMPDAQVVASLDAAEAGTADAAQRTARLMSAVAGNPQLRESLGAFCDPKNAPGISGDYVDWLHARLGHYARLAVRDIEPGELLHDVRCIAAHPRTKIPNMGVALASNLLADIGIRASSKPDLHVLETVRSLTGDPKLKPEACIRELIGIAQRECEPLRSSGRFAWLVGGLYPRDVDRMVYLIGSDNFTLDGRQSKYSAPVRRALMAQALASATGWPRTGTACPDPCLDGPGACASSL